MVCKSCGWDLDLVLMVDGWEMLCDPCRLMRWLAEDLHNLNRFHPASQKEAPNA